MLDLPSLFGPIRIVRSWMGIFSAAEMLLYRLTENDTNLMTQNTVHATSLRINGGALGEGSPAQLICRRVERRPREGRHPACLRPRLAQPRNPISHHAKVAFHGHLRTSGRQSVIQLDEADFIPRLRLRLAARAKIRPREGKLWTLPSRIR